MAVANCSTRIPWAYPRWYGFCQHHLFCSLDRKCLFPCLKLTQVKPWISSIRRQNLSQHWQQKVIQRQHCLSRSVRFQRSIGRFLNAEAEERSEMIAHAERQLEILIHDESPDGDAICRIVRRWLGWLRAPVFATAVSKEAASPSKEGKSCSENLQSRVRKLLISCLAHLDLADVNTQEALEPALEYLVQIFDKLDFPIHLSTLATGQWRKLQKLLDEVRSETGAETLAMEKAPKLRRATKASVVQDSFVPPTAGQEFTWGFYFRAKRKSKMLTVWIYFQQQLVLAASKDNKSTCIGTKVWVMQLVKRGLVGGFPNVLGSPWSMCPLSLLMPITCYFVSTINASPIVFNVVVRKSVLTRSDASDARCARRPNEEHLKNLEPLASQVFATGTTTVHRSFWCGTVISEMSVIYGSAPPKKGPKAPFLHRVSEASQWNWTAFFSGVNLISKKRPID